MESQSWSSLDGIDDYFETLNAEGPRDIGTLLGVVVIPHGGIV